MVTWFKSNHFYFALCLISSVALFSANPRYLFTHDSQHKLIQAVSVWEQGFSTEELLYPLRAEDPEYKLYAYRDTYLLQLDGRNIGQYPVFFSSLSALLYGLGGPLILPIAGFVFSMLSLVYIGRIWKLNSRAHYLAIFALPILLFSLDYTETNWMMGIVFLGLSLILDPKAESSAGLGRSVLGGLLMGLGIFLRLEVLPFACSMFLAMAFIWWQQSRSERPAWQKSMLGGVIGFSIALIIFALWNYYDYGHILGPRFLVNVKGIGFSGFRDLVLRLLALILLRDNGVGILGAAPYLLVTFWVLLRSGNHRQLDFRRQVLLWGSLILIPGLALVAPNDGVFNPVGPRYLALVYFPVLVLIDASIRQRDSDPKRWKWATWLHRLGVVWSLCIFLVAFLVLPVGGRINQQFQTELDQLDVDIRVFGEQRSMYNVGLEYFDPRPTVLVKNQIEWQHLRAILKARPEATRIGYIIGREPAEITGLRRKLAVMTGTIVAYFKVRNDWRSALGLLPDLAKDCQKEAERKLKFYTAHIFLCK